ncbi:MAG: alfa-L-rhamnosidase, partial [bacterium]|nr:alfa-L-rhamnosidase [bacterium]
PINWVKASYDSIRGTICSEWKVSDGKFQLNVTIPANTTATVYLPTKNPSSITESGNALSNTANVSILRQENNVVALTVESGSYEFSASSGIAPAKVPLKSSAPKDNSINPGEIDLTGATKLESWDFRDPQDLAKWGERKSLQIEQRNDVAYLVATGEDSQMAVRLSKPLEGKLVIELRASPSQNSTSQFYWAIPGRGFNGQQQTKRLLRQSDNVNDYLFTIPDGLTVGKLRLDPFATYDKYANAGEMMIESISIYQLAD